MDLGPIRDHVVEIRSERARRARRPAGSGPSRSGPRPWRCCRSCCMTLSSPSPSWYRVSTPILAPFADSGYAKTAPTPARWARSTNDGQRADAETSSRGACTNVFDRNASWHGPSPIVYCRSSSAAIRGFDTHTGPAWPPPMIVIPAPVTSSTSTHAAHKRASGDLAASRANATAIRMRLVVVQSDPLRRNTSDRHVEHASSLTTEWAARSGPDQALRKRGADTTSGQAGQARSV